VPILLQRRPVRAGVTFLRKRAKGLTMDWVTFETEGGGVLKVQARHVVAIYNELGSVKLSTTAGGVHTLASGLTVAQAASMVGDTDAE
jgi:hypothetical protein